MSEDIIYQKTGLGKSEMEASSDALTMEQRRVLILVNGARSISVVAKQSVVDNPEAVIEMLHERGFIEQLQKVGTATDAIADETPVTSAESSDGYAGAAAREFMANTLLAYGNRIRVKKLVDDINGASDSSALEELVKPWYSAIAETPNGMYQADDLKAQAMTLIQQ